MSDSGRNPGGEPEDEPVLSRLQPFPWDQDAAVAYEAVLDALNDVIGIHAHRIHRLEQQEQPDAAALAELRESQRHYVQVRRSLSHQDGEAVRRIGAECAAVVDEFRRSLG